MTTPESAGVGSSGVGQLDGRMNLGRTTTHRITRALRSLRAAALLTGARGAEPVDLAAVGRAAALAGDLLLSEDLDLLELNPLIAGPDGCVAVDAVAMRH